MKKVLVVDDDPGIVTLLSTMLRREGFIPVAAHNGHDALEQIEATCPDLILLDLAMPGMDGFEILAEIRRRENGVRRIPIIILTAHLRSYFEARIDTHIDGYITKPLTLDKLRENLRQFIPA